MQRKTGARALRYERRFLERFATSLHVCRSILERILLDAKFECPGANMAEVQIDAEVVKGERRFQTTTKKSTPTDGADFINN